MAAAVAVAPLLVYRALSGGLPLLVGLVLAAKWGIRELAAYTVASSLIAIGAVITDWGSSRSLPRDLATADETDARQLIASLNSIRLILAVVVGVAVIGATLWGVFHEDTVRYTLLLSPLLILNPLAINGVSVRLVHSELKPFAFAVAGNVVVLLAVAIVLSGPLGGASLAAAVVAGKTAECIALVGKRTWIIRASGEDLSSVALRVLPFSAQYILGTIYSRVPVLVLDRLATREAVGVLGAATTLQGVLLLIPTSIALFRFPAVTLAVRNREWPRVRAIVVQYLTVSLGALLACAIVLALAMPVIAPRLDIPSAHRTFVLVFALCAIPTVGVLISTVVIQARRAEAVAARIAAAGLAASVLLQWALVLRFGLWGSAVALLTSELFLLVLYGRAAMKQQVASHT